MKYQALRFLMCMSWMHKMMLMMMLRYEMHVLRCLTPRGVTGTIGDGEAEP